jgi:hypothetical protein
MTMKARIFTFIPDWVSLTPFIAQRITPNNSQSDSLVAVRPHTPRPFGKKLAGRRLLQEPE